MKLYTVNGVLCDVNGERVSDDVWREWQAEQVAAYDWRLETERRNARYDARMGAGVQWNRAARAGEDDKYLCSERSAQAELSSRGAVYVGW